MAKSEKKVEEVQDDMPLPPDPKLVESEQKAAKYEDLLAEVLPALHRFRLHLPNTSVARDANQLYIKVRDSLGERGLEVDRKMRGV